MGLSGNLEDLALSDILQIIYLSRKTGTLSLKKTRGFGAIIFHNGLIMQASCPLKLKTIQSVLVDKKLVSPKDMVKARKEAELQKGRKSPLTILKNSGVLPGSVIENLTRKKIERNLFELLQWKSGTFQFDLDSLNLGKSAGFNSEDVLLEEGLAPQTVFTEAAKFLDRKQVRDKQENDKKSDSLPEKEMKGRPQKSKPTSLEPIVKPEERDDSASDMMAEIKETIKPSATFDMAGPEPLPPKTCDKTIILLDDERVFLTIVSRKLEEHGFTVHSHEDLTSAIENITMLIAENRNPILVTDLVVPMIDHDDNLGGLTFLKMIHERYPHVPVILVSDQHDPEIRYQAYELGARNYLYKPDRAQVKFADVPLHIQHFADELALCLNNICRERERLGEMLQSLSDIKKVSQAASDDFASELEDQSVDLSKMKQIFYELQNPRETSEVVLLVLRLASETLERGILFLIRDNVIQGIGGFGRTMSGQPIINKMSQCKIDRTKSKFFNEVINSQKMVFISGQIDFSEEPLFQLIGEPLNKSFTIIPLLNDEKVISIFYGDNGTMNKPLKNLRGLEIFINQAGPVLENALLQRRLKGKIF